MSKPNSETAVEKKAATPRSSKPAAKAAARPKTKPAVTTARPGAKRGTRVKPRPRPQVARAAVARVVVPVKPVVTITQPPLSAPIADPQSAVVASKFRSEPPPARPRPLPTLPSSYGESHLLLLARDPQTLFAAWDMAPSAVSGIKSRLGTRGFAVSNLTLRLSGAGATSVFHLAKRTRSRYLKVDGGPVYVAEIGLTTPAGRFELLARSAPCVVPTGPASGRDPVGGKRTALGYREAQVRAQRGLSPVPPPEGSGARGVSESVSASASSASPAAVNGRSSTRVSTTPRVLGGASDLYRR